MNVIIIAIMSFYNDFFYSFIEQSGYSVWPSLSTESRYFGIYVYISIIYKYNFIIQPNSSIDNCILDNHGDVCVSVCVRVRA